MTMAVLRSYSYLAPSMVGRYEAGQAYLAAHHLMDANRDAVSKIADALVEKRELYGDDVLRLLDAQKVNLPEVDLTKDEAWPRL